MSSETTIDTGYLPAYEAFPLSPDVHDFIRRHVRVYVVDQNRDAQMLGLFRLECDADQIGRLRSVLHYNGLPVDARAR